MIVRAILPGLLLTLLQAGNLTAQDADQDRIEGVVSVGMEMIVPSGASIEPAHLLPESPSIVYPDSALRKKLEGSVSVMATIKTNGSVSTPEVTDATSPVFAASALKSIADFRFRPATSGGEPIEIEVRIDVDFAVEGDWERVHGEDRADSSGGWAFVADYSAPQIDRASFERALTYPVDAVEPGEEQEVHIRVHVSATGEILETMVLRGSNQALIDAAVTAIRKATFTPAIKEDQPTAGWLTVPVSFAVEEVAADSENEPRRVFRPAASADPTTPPKFDLAELQGNYTSPADIDPALIPAEIRARVLILESGEVGEILLPEGLPEQLIASLSRAIQRTSFTPAKHEEDPIATWVTLTISTSE